MHPSTLLLLSVLAVDPQVSRTVADIATSQGELRANAVNRYAAGCKGSKRFVWRNNKQALEALKPVFSDADATVRKAALGLVLCYPAGTFEQEILALLADKDDAVRERAFEEAAHHSTPAIAAGLAELVEGCQAKLDGLEGQGLHWCVFSLYALGEQGSAVKGDRALRTRIADLSAPFAAAGQAKLRQHALRNLDMLGTSQHAVALEALARGDGKASGDPVTAAERKEARKVMGKLKRRR